MWVPPFLFTLALPSPQSMQIYAEQNQKIFLNNKGKQIFYLFFLSLCFTDSSWWWCHVVRLEAL